MTKSPKWHTKVVQVHRKGAFYGRVGINRKVQKRTDKGT